MLNEKEKLITLSNIVDLDRFRKPLLEEFIDEFEYESLETRFSEGINSNGIPIINETWRKTSSDSIYNYNTQPKYYKEILENNEARVKKEIPFHRLKAWLTYTPAPLKFIWKGIDFTIFSIENESNYDFVYYMDNLRYTYTLEEFNEKCSKENAWFNWKYFEGIFIGTQKDTNYSEHLENEKRLDHLDDLKQQVITAHMEKPKKETFLPYKPDVVTYTNKKDWKNKKRKKEKDLAEKNRLAQMKLYNPKEGNRKQRRNKYNKWGQPGNRYAKLQQIAIKEKDEKVVYKNGKNILVTIDKFTNREIPKMEPMSVRIIIPSFMYTNETIDDKTRILKKGKYVIKITTGKFHRYIQAKYKTITQHLYPRYQCKLFTKAKEQAKQFQKELEEMQKKAKQKKITKTALPKKKAVVKSRQQKKGD